MANTLKSKSTPKVNSPILNPDKEADVVVSEVVKDERTMKILGAVSLLISLFLFVAFTSYLFTWQEDQDMVQLWRTQLFSLQDVKANNLLGYIGAFVAYQMMFNGFGIAAYLFCTFFFVLGVNLFFTKPIFSLWRNLRYVLMGLLVLSTCFAYFTPNTDFSWGGALGEYSSSWLIKWVGRFGTGAILFIAGFSYVIWRFNPSFNVPNFDFLIPKKKTPDFVSEDTEEAVKQEWDLNNPPSALEPVASGNTLKENPSGVAIIMPEADETEEALGELGPKLFIDELSLEEESDDEKKTPLVNDEEDEEDEEQDMPIQMSMNVSDIELPEENEETLTNTKFAVHLQGEYVETVDDQSPELFAYLDLNRAELDERIHELWQTPSDANDLIFFNFGQQKMNYNSYAAYFTQNGFAPVEPNVKSWMEYYLRIHNPITPEEIAIQLKGPLQYSFIPIKS